MKFNNIFILIVVSVSAIFELTFANQANFYSQQLGWIHDPKVCYVCGGYYKDFLIPYSPNPLVVDQSHSFDVSADQTTYSLKGGATILKGHVRIARPDEEEMTADLAYVFYTEAGDPKLINAFGNVHYHADGKLIIGKKGRFDLLHNTMKMDHVIYRIARNAGEIITVTNAKTGKTEKHLRQLTAWGTADSAEKTGPLVYVFKNATYETCSPDKGTWHVKAKTITLDKKTGRGTAKHTFLYIKKAPVFYFPYFNFPINKDRKSGFLFPSYGHSSRSGYTLSIPYYFNLAPNYDATLTPSIMTKRGVYWDGLFRYLTPSSSGTFNADYIFDDQAFKKYQQDAETKYAGQTNLNRLLDASDNRYGFGWQNQTTFNPKWSSMIDFNAVSDDYFIEDFGTGLDNSDNQLTQQAQVNYNGEHWSFLGNLLHYQTLHPVDQDAVSNQYAKLPQLQFNGSYPDFYHLLSFSINNEVVNFEEQANPGVTTEPTTGDRFSTRPALSLPLTWPFGFLTPRIQMQMTQYNLSNPYQTNPKQPGIAIPMADVKGGLYFDRFFDLFHRSYHQTFEPTVYYLYVPYYDQTQLPIFDTTGGTFNYDYIFQDNRFNGADRVGDANQVGVGLTTRFLDPDTGDEQAHASIGELYYFRDRDVLLTNDPNAVVADINQQRLSPIAGNMTYNLNASWSVSADLTWNPYANQFVDEDATLNYKPNPNQLLNFGYNFVRSVDASTGLPDDNSQNDLKQTDITGYWKLTPHWSIIGRWNYNWSKSYAQTYFGGIAYESCCWAVRAVYAKSFLNLNESLSPHYNYTFALQVALKGLGDFDNNNPSGLLVGSVSGYQDMFGQEV